MDLKNRIELIVIYLVSLSVIIISILDFSGALDSLPWLSQRIPIMTLLTVGLVALYLVSQQNRNLKGSEQKVRTMDYVEGYTELRKKVRNAKKEIVILTQYRFGWEEGKHNWAPERLNSQERKDFYIELQTKLNREERNKDFKFTKIVGIPHNHQLNEIFEYDPLYVQNCKFVVSMYKRKGVESTQLRVSNMNFGNSIILIDQTFAHISFDIQYHDDSKYEAPFVMLVDDPTSLAIQRLIDIYIRIKDNNSELIKELARFELNSKST
jgi:hypothetical protein